MNKQLDEQLIKQWIDALRSGEYRQIRYRMRTCAGFCCLGVLCDVAGIDWSTIPAISLVKNSFPPIDLAEKTGLTQKVKSSPLAQAIKETLKEERLRFRYLENNTQGDLSAFMTTLNDKFGWDFSQIADWIEQHILPMATKDEMPET